MRQNIKKKLKISVHIPFYLNKDKFKKFRILKKVCNSYLKLSKETKIFIHTNIKFKLKNKKIKILFYNLKNIHPFRLTWFPRKLMKKQTNNFDIFIYAEDDVLFTKKNLKYWLNNKNVCIENKFNLGFLRIEKNNHLFAIDQIKKFSFFKKINNKRFAIVENPYCAMWIYEKKEFKKFIKSKYFNFKWDMNKIGKVNLDREMSGIGWHGQDIKKGFNMGHYIATIIPINKNKLDTGSYIKHLPNNYSKNPAGLFGTIKLNDLMKKNLTKFKKPSKMKLLSYKTLFNLYSLFRINLKDLKKGLIN